MLWLTQMVMLLLIMGIGLLWIWLGDIVFNKKQRVVIAVVSEPPSPMWLKVVYAVLLIPPCGVLLMAVACKWWQRFNFIYLGGGW